MLIRSSKICFRKKGKRVAAPATTNTSHLLHQHTAKKARKHTPQSVSGDRDFVQYFVLLCFLTFTHLLPLFALSPFAVLPTLIRNY